MTHFDHERIPERVVHAGGSAAHGIFKVYEPQSALLAVGQHRFWERELARKIPG